MGRWTERLMDGQIDRWIGDEQTHGWMDGLTNIWIDRRTDRHTVGHTDRQTDRP